MSDRKADVAFDHLLLQTWTFASFPQLRTVQDPISQRPAIRSFAARDGTRDTDELGAHFGARQAYRRIAVPARVEEFEVGREVRIPKRFRSVDVERLRIFERRANSVKECHIISPVRLCRAWPVRNVKGFERIGLLEPIFEAFHGPGADKRSAHETQADRLELARREHRRRIARPEAVTVARHDRETGDLRVADEIVDLLP